MIINKFAFIKAICFLFSLADLVVVIRSQSVTVCIGNNIFVAVHEYANSTSAHDTVLEHRFSPT